MADTIPTPRADVHPTEAERPVWYKRKTTRRRISLWTNTLIILIGAFILMIPLAWMLSTSLKANGEVFHIPINWIPKKVLFQNYPEAINYVPIPVYYRNSVFVASLAVLGSVISSSLVAFAFARLRAPGKNILFIILLSTLMLPSEVTLVPIYLTMRVLGWLDSFRPLIIPYWFGGAFYIFLLRQFFMTIPTELDDAAKIDGATFFDIYWRIVLPLSKPALATVAIFSFYDSWNDFRSPLIYLNTDTLLTLPVGLNQYMSTLGNTHWNYLMAASLLTLLPPLLIFFFAQRFFIQGAILTGLKG
jgi:ABC-type glycerol-3-phosphate transport system permease component